MVFIVGCDPSSKKLAVVITRVGNIQRVDVRVETLSFRDKPRACSEAFGFFTDLIEEFGERRLDVYYEAPVLGRGGARATIPQSYIAGAVQAACFLRDTPITFVNNTSWKSKVIGTGKADKTLIAQRLCELWPAAFRAAKGDMDLYDAACINCYGTQINKSASRIVSEGVKRKPAIRKRR